jgi:septum formation protein
MMTAPLLVLGSTSPYRRELLGRLGLPFETCSPGVDETPTEGEAPRDRALRLAIAKARAVALEHPGAIVIGSDQVASLEEGGASRILRKPGTAGRCLEQLLTLSGRAACFDTAVAVIAPGREIATHVDITRVRFRPFDAADASRYIAREPAFDCAGGFKCEGLGVTLMDALETTDPTGLVGLPLIWLAGALRGAGLSLP